MSIKVFVETFTQPWCGVVAKNVAKVQPVDKFAQKVHQRGYCGQIWLFKNVSNLIAFNSEYKRVQRKWLMSFTFPPRTLKSTLFLMHSLTPTLKLLHNRKPYELQCKSATLSVVTNDDWDTPSVELSPSTVSKTTTKLNRETIFITNNPKTLPRRWVHVAKRFLHVTSRSIRVRSTFMNHHM